MLKLKTKNLIGIDIRDNAIRLVELSYLKGNYTVENILRGDIASLKDLKTKNVAIALPHSAIIFKEIELEQRLTDKEIEDFLQLNIEKYIGEPANNISFDYKIVNMNDSIILQLITARRECVEKHIKLLQEANLYPKIIDIDSYALERAVRRQVNNISGLVAIINIDHETILIVVLDHEKIVHTYEDFISAEEMQSVDQVVAKLRLKLHEPLEKIILSGEGVAIPGLDITINIQFNVETTIIDPFFGMQVSEKIDQKIAPAMLISSGLALRVSDDNWN